MERVQLIHPESKKAITMDIAKYEALKTSFLDCLKRKKIAAFPELLAEVPNDLERREIHVQGKLDWNLFRVILDLEAKGTLYKDRTSSPIKCSRVMVK